ncbi:cytochrome P450 [Streptomyces malaysiensis subsp. malaysiensis]|uniref:Cytochrome P450 n=1 Tax=Streptomyces malaysiensis TaxID=92644 RepID=A0ABX6W746_STRMQ|nr:MULTISPECIES: cytochrome P450 [Streptomyces]QPI57312.1 cytochrome P450 [Streptomyces solisilvae]UHH18859.1 cytochrome P450 [Streptomyces sp. HNM0561]
MTQTQGSLVRQITDYAHRADPYPLYAELRKTPVAHDEEGPYIVSTYWEIHGLLHDPRLSSDARNLDPRAAPELIEEDGEEDEPGLPPSFLRLDPPEHDRLRSLAMAPFGPPNTPRRLHTMRGELTRIVGELIDGFEGRDRIDLVDHFSYPFPVTVICRLLGVPREDEPRFHAWADTVAAGLDPDPDADEDAAERRRVSRQARTDLAVYLSELIEERRRAPGDDMLSALVGWEGPEGRMSRVELLSTAALLLVAGHETTVNLITNGMLTLLRNPEVLARLRNDPHLVVPLVEELLRFDPPVQMLPRRTPLSEIDIAGVTIPRGASVWLLLASGNRDAQRFLDPDRFEPQRRDNQHLGFGSGVHSCFGAPLARLEAQIALTELARRLDGPRLLEDPPTYRRNAVLRGPRHLPLAFEGLRPGGSPNGSR